MNRQRIAVEKMYDNICSDASSIVEKFQVIFSELSKNQLDFSVDSLQVIEDMYWNVVDETKECFCIDSLDDLEYYLALYLGQTFIVNNNGNWVIYEGKNIVLKPIVIKLQNSMHIDVFAFCKDLNRKTMLLGYKQKKVLTSYYNMSLKGIFK